MVCFVIYAYDFPFPHPHPPPPDPCGVTILICNLSILNGLAVRWFGTSEFYMSIFKIFLMMGLMFYTFITMVGGNPNGNAYGFTYWQNPVCGPFFPRFFPLLFADDFCSYKRVHLSNTLLPGLLAAFSECWRVWFKVLSRKFCPSRLCGSAH